MWQLIGFAALLLLAVGLTWWLLIRHDRKTPGKTADADGLGPLVDIGQGTSRREWPASAEEHPARRCATPGCPNETRVGTLCDECADKPELLAADFRPAKPGTVAAQVLRDQFGGANLAEFIDRAIEGGIDVYYLYLLEAVCKRGRHARMQTESRHSTLHPASWR